MWPEPRQTNLATGEGLFPVQHRRLVRFEIEQCVNIRCHCLPGFDDGPETTTEALALCRALIADGVTTVIATPHQLGRYDGQNGPDDVRRAVDCLNAALADERLPLRVLPGAEVRIDERIARLLEEDRITALADGGRYLLVELPREAPINPMPLVRELAGAGVGVILAHPERCACLVRDPHIVLPWVGRGLAVQVNAGGLVGAHGRQVQRACGFWLISGAASLLASDAHDAVTRRPCMSEAIAFISAQLGPAAARRICLANPLRVLNGSAVESVPAGSLVGGRS